jgi:hypothetical protein
MHFSDKQCMAPRAPSGPHVWVIADKPGFGNIDVHVPGRFSPVAHSHLTDSHFISDMRISGSETIRCQMTF